jgi:hypothetical protein
VRIMVCGPVGDAGPRKIEKMERFLRKRGFEVTGQFGISRRDYSDIGDFSTRKKLSDIIVKGDLKLVRKADVLVVLPTPSFGAAIEMYVGKKLGKKIILFTEKPMPSPWPVYFSDFVATSRKSLIGKLDKLDKKKSAKN